MSKKRRTKKEKMAASTRHEFSNVLVLPKMPEITEPAKPAEYTAQKHTASTGYAYVIGDIRRTLFIISAIAILNFIFFLSLKFRLINILGLSF
jgi:hypothetical protein